MKKIRLKKEFAAVMAVSVFSIWFALPNVAYAKIVTIDGRNIEATLIASSSSATATISYTEGSGQVTASLTGDAHSILAPGVSLLVPKGSSNPTPGGASASISAPSGYKFTAVDSSSSYEVYIHGTTYKGTIPDRWVE